METKSAWRLQSRHVVVPAAVRARSGLAVGLIVLAVAMVLVVLAPPVVSLPLLGVAVAVWALLARHALGDLLAGVTLLLAQPYAEGERVRLSVAGAAPVDAEVLQVRLLRTTLCSDDGVLVVANRHLLVPAA